MIRAYLMQVKNYTGSKQLLAIHIKLFFCFFNNIIYKMKGVAKGVTNIPITLLIILHFFSNIIYKSNLIYIL